MSSRFSKTPNSHYYAVIFTSQLSKHSKGYSEMGEKMLQLALEQPGCYGAESTRDSAGFGITVSYWDSEESIARWKSHTQHLAAQKMGIERWYEHYELRVAKVERAYSGPLKRSVRNGSD